MGDYGVSERSITIHALSGRPRLGCGTLTARVATATFGTSGTIRFEQIEEFDPLIIASLDTSSLGTPRSSDNWHVHSYPAIWGDCGTTNGHYNPDSTKAGELAKNSGIEIGGGTNEFLTNPKNGLTLFGRNSIIGRSIVMHMDDGAKVCANVWTSDTLKRVRAGFNGPDIFGFIILQQPLYDPTAPTMVFASLRSSEAEVGSHKWHVHASAPDGTDGELGSVDTDYAGRCASTGGHWDPKDAGVCSGGYDASMQCEIGDLSGKHGLFDLSTDTKTFFFTDLNLPLTGENGVDERSITIHAVAGAPRLACAALTTKKKYAKFGVHGEYGVVSIYQVDEFSPLVTVDLNLPAAPRPSDNWHVHEFPVMDDDCDDTGAHYNPPGTQAGELAKNSGRVLTLGNNSFTVTPDNGLTLHGVNSILGRSMVIHMADNTKLCANILPEGAVKNVKATFDGPDIEGFIILQQPYYHYEAPTTVFASLKRSASLTTTIGHNWHVHEEPVAYDSKRGSDKTEPPYARRCLSTGGHWNPFNATLCTAGGDRKTCEVGDLAGKHGKLELTSEYKKFFFTDQNLPLNGNFSVDGRSVVIHDGAPRLGCASLVAKHAIAKFDGGTITFDQIRGFPVVVRVNMVVEGVRPADNWHIHEFPVHAGDCSTTGGHYNPGGRDEGELSKNSRPLQSGSNVFAVTPGSLTMLDENSIVGRSVVIHLDNGEKICADILRQVTMKSVHATFEGPVVFGDVIMRQPFNSAIAPTTIYANLYAVTDQTLEELEDLPWHIHENSVAENDNKCASVGGHYDPKKTNKLCEGVPYSDSHTCEVGDVVGKHGSITLKKEPTYALWTDSFLPLSEEFSVSGRSIVLHLKDGTKACATLGVLEAEAKFGDFGKIKFTQAINEPVIISVDLKGVTGIRSGDDNWHVHEFPVFDEDDCTRPGSHFNVGGELSLDTGVPLKDGDNVFQTESTSDLTLFGSNSIIGRSIVIHKEAGYLCATITAKSMPHRTATAEFSSGTISLRQVRGLDTFIHVTLDITGVRAKNNWHVHELPVVDDDCSTTGGHYNPMLGEVQTTAGELDNNTATTISNGTNNFVVSGGTELTMFGYNSIIGRSIVIHRASGGRYCTNVKAPEELKTREVEFDGPDITGKILFSQAKNNPKSPTTIFGTLTSKGNGTYNWHVHTELVEGDSAVGSKDDNYAGRCKSTGGHFDPYLLGPCASLQKPPNPFQCEVGDLAGKHGKLVFEAGQPTTFFFTDDNLRLSGDEAFSIEDRSLVFHDGAPRVACASIAERATTTTTAKIADQVNNSEEPNSIDGVAIGVGVGVTIGLFLIIGLVVYICKYKKDECTQCCAKRAVKRRAKKSTATRKTQMFKKKAAANPAVSDFI